MSRPVRVGVLGGGSPGHPAGFPGGLNPAREVLSGYAATPVVAMPDETVARSLDAVVNHGRTVRQAFRGLGRTPPTSEIHGVA